MLKRTAESPTKKLTQHHNSEHRAGETCQGNGGSRHQQVIGALVLVMSTQDNWTTI